MRGLPGYLRCLEPSNFWAMSLRYRPGVRFGHTRRFGQRLATESFADLRKVDVSGSDKRNRAGKCARKNRFSAAKYSFWRSSFGLTRPVTYASRRIHLFSFIWSGHNTARVQPAPNSLTLRGSYKWPGDEKAIHASAHAVTTPAMGVHKPAISRRPANPPTNCGAAKVPLGVAIALYTRAPPTSNR